jgi:hypothetical protein
MVGSEMTVAKGGPKFKAVPFNPKANGEGGHGAWALQLSFGANIPWIS